jgi:hypothetical protein
MLKLVIEEGSALREVDATPRARQVLSRYSSLSAPQLEHAQGILAAFCLDVLNIEYRVEK